MVDCTALEMRHRCKPIGGSNSPPLRHPSRLSGFVWQATLETRLKAARFGFTCQTASSPSCPAQAGHPAFQRHLGGAALSLEYWVARSSRATTSRKDTTQHSRGTFAPEVMHRLVPRKRGHRECRAPVAPAALRVKIENTQVSHHRHAETSGIPCTMVFAAYTRSCVCKICQNVRTGGSHKTARRWI